MKRAIIFISFQINKRHLLTGSGTALLSIMIVSADEASTG
jgi:hypothetical protein